MSDIQTVMAVEKDRLTTKRTELATALADVDHELSAIAAYETAKNGKATARGSKRETVLAIIKDSAGITRGDIIEKLKAQGQDAPEAGLSNMLSTLKKAGKITADDGKYAIAA